VCMKAEVHPPTTNTTNPMRTSSGLHTKYMCAAIQLSDIEAARCSIPHVLSRGRISMRLFASRTPPPRPDFRKVSMMLSDFLAGRICTMHYNSLYEIPHVSPINSSSSGFQLH
jgi:hypothetical protein